MRGETVTHKKYVPGEKDAYGHVKPATWVLTDLENVGVDMGATYEPRDGTVERTVADLTLFLPSGFECDAKDHFVVRGSEYQVEGAVNRLTNMFTGKSFHTEVLLRRYA